MIKSFVNHRNSQSCTIKSLEENLSIPTIYYNSFTAAHGEKMHNINILDAN